MVVPVDNVLNEIKENNVEFIVFKPYSKSDDYFSLFGMRDSVIKVARLVWVEELYNIFNGLGIDFDIDLVVDGEPIKI